jgi:uncharacterized membrane protein HdeD (DUF308 family)
MLTLLRFVSRNMWGSLIVGILAILLGGFALIEVLVSGIDPTANPLRYVFFGVLFVAAGVYGIWNAIQLRQNRTK